LPLPSTPLREWCAAATTSLGHDLSHDRQRNFLRRDGANVEPNWSANLCESFFVRSAFAQALQHNIRSAFASD
jgi:hypothetical protein